MFRDARRDTWDNLVADQAQLVTIQNQLTLIAGANSTLSSISDTTLIMGQKLNGFSDIWAAVKSDCAEVVIWLNSVDNQLDLIIPQVLWAATNPVNCAYQSITMALQEHQYAIGIDSSSIPPPTKRGLSDFPSTLHANVAALIAAALAKAQQA
ncbi:hypothetical protein B0H17DRAFT_1206524 [Mycena rosella]|uniref:Uncharacterized protein n=1 Tax=Mycena rosella TaxID=1033263 RepID=A0AAD7D545_MYCRO|nr:hypothetical protein B0H17DRAFT_1206524 [Mycena rosella]